MNLDSDPRLTAFRAEVAGWLADAGLAAVSYQAAGGRSGRQDRLA